MLFLKALMVTALLGLLSNLPNCRHLFVGCPDPSYIQTLQSIANKISLEVERRLVLLKARESLPGEIKILGLEELETSEVFQLKETRDMWKPKEEAAIRYASPGAIGSKIENGWGSSGTNDDSRRGWTPNSIAQEEERARIERESGLASGFVSKSASRRMSRSSAGVSRTVSRNESTTGTNSIPVRRGGGGGWGTNRSTDVNGPFADGAVTLRKGSDVNGLGVEGEVGENDGWCNVNEDPKTAIDDTESSWNVEGFGTKSPVDMEGHKCPSPAASPAIHPGRLKLQPDLDPPSQNQRAFSVHPDRQRLQSPSQYEPPSFQRNETPHSPPKRAASAIHPDRQRLQSPQDEPRRDQAPSPPKRAASAIHPDRQQLQSPSHNKPSSFQRDEAPPCSPPKRAASAIHPDRQRLQEQKQKDLPPHLSGGRRESVGMGLPRPRARVGGSRFGGDQITGTNMVPLSKKSRWGTGSGGGGDNGGGGGGESRESTTKSVDSGYTSAPPVSATFTRKQEAVEPKVEENNEKTSASEGESGWGVNDNNSEKDDGWGCTPKTEAQTTSGWGKGDSHREETSTLAKRSPWDEREKGPSRVSLSNGVQHKKRLFIGNLSYTTDDAMLKNHFSKFSKPTSGGVQTNRLGESLGYGFLSYDSENEAKVALEQLRDSRLDGRNINVEYATGRRPLNSSEHRGPEKGKPKDYPKETETEIEIETETKTKGATVGTDENQTGWGGEVDRDVDYEDFMRGETSAEKEAEEEEVQNSSAPARAKTPIPTQTKSPTSPETKTLTPTPPRAKTPIPAPVKTPIPPPQVKTPIPPPPQAKTPIPPPTPSPPQQNSSTRKAPTTTARKISLANSSRQQIQIIQSQLHQPQHPHSHPHPHPQPPRGPIVVNSPTPQPQPRPKSLPQPLLIDFSDDEQNADSAPTLFSPSTSKDNKGETSIVLSSSSSSLETEKDPLVVVKAAAEPSTSPRSQSRSKSPSSEEGEEEEGGSDIFILDPNRPQALIDLEDDDEEEEKDGMTTPTGKKKRKANLLKFSIQHPQPQVHQPVKTTAESLESWLMGVSLEVDETKPLLFQMPPICLPHVLRNCCDKSAQECHHEHNYRLNDGHKRQLVMELKGLSGRDGSISGGNLPQSQLQLSQAQSRLMGFGAVGNNLIGLGSRPPSSVGSTRVKSTSTSMDPYTIGGDGGGGSDWLGTRDAIDPIKPLLCQKPRLCVEYYITGTCHSRGRGSCTLSHSYILTQGQKSLLEKEAAATICPDWSTKPRECKRDWKCYYSHRWVPPSLLSLLEKDQ